MQEMLTFRNNHKKMQKNVLRIKLLPVYQGNLDTNSNIAYDYDMTTGQMSLSCSRIGSPV